MSKLSFIITIIILIISAYTDLRYRKVLNIITFPSIVLGLVLFKFPFTGESLYRLLWMMIFFALGYFRMMGLGDLKLIMAVTALRGIEESSGMLLAGISLLLMYCFLKDRKNTVSMLKDTYSTIFYHTPVIKRSNKEYPLAAFLFLGYIITILARRCLFA